MKSLLCAVSAALLLVASIASATPHVETVFTIPLPGAETTHPKPTEVLRGDILYVGTDAGIVAANLTSKTVAWTANITNAAGQNGHHDSVALAFRGDSVFACSKNGAYKLNAASGHQDWVFPLAFEESNAFKCNFTFSDSGTKVAIMLPNTVVVVNTASGANAGGGTLFYSNGYAVGESSSANGTTIIYGSTMFGNVTATGLWSGKQLWTFNPHSNPSLYGFTILTALNGKYLVCTNLTDQSNDVSLVVLSAADGTVKVNIGAMNGIVDSGFTPKIINGHDLVVVAGYEILREVTIDLNTGYIIKQVPYTGGSSNGDGSNGFSVKATDINAEISVTDGLELKVGPIGGPYTTVASFVPSASSFNLQYYSQGVVQVGNLQGWTMWQVSAVTKNATFLARNEKSPGWKASKGTPLTYNGAYIHVNGNEIVAEKLVF